MNWAMISSLVWTFGRLPMALATSRPLTVPGTTRARSHCQSRFSHDQHEFSCCQEECSRWTRGHFCFPSSHAPEAIISPHTPRGLQPHAYTFVNHPTLPLVHRNRTRTSFEFSLRFAMAKQPLARHRRPIAEGLVRRNRQKLMAHFHPLVWVLYSTHSWAQAGVNQRGHVRQGKRLNGGMFGEKPCQLSSHDNGTSIACC